MYLTQRPGPHECFGYHQGYVGNVPDGNIIETLSQQQIEVPKFMASIPANQMEVIHEPYGWKIRTVIEHCCDAERVFGYRALRFATGDTTDLPGWDENHYASCGYGDCQSPESLAEEFRGLRSANLCLLKRLSPAAFEQIGTGNGIKASVRTLAWLMAGHWLHHYKILNKRLSTSEASS